MTSINTLRVPLAVALAFAATTALASDWPWREQVDADVFRTDGKPVYLVEGSRAASSALWREQVSPAEDGAAGAMVRMSKAADSDWLLWRDQRSVSRPDLAATPRLRLSGEAAKSGARE